MVSSGGYTRKGGGQKTRTQEVFAPHAPTLIGCIAYQENVSCKGFAGSFIFTRKKRSVSVIRTPEKRMFPDLGGEGHYCSVLLPSFTPGK